MGEKHFEKLLNTFDRKWTLYMWNLLCILLSVTGEYRYDENVFYSSFGDTFNFMGLLCSCIMSLKYKTIF